MLEVCSRLLCFPCHFLLLTSLGVETNAMVWSFVEVAVGTVAACIPTLRPIINARTPESIVNSVRSAITLNSLSSSARRRALQSSVGASGTDLKDFEQLTSSRSNHDANSTITDIEAADSNHRR